MKTKLYLLPGLMCDKRLWCKLEPLLRSHYELIHLDIPLADNLDEMVEILQKKLPTERVNLLGFSLGGYIASYFACKFEHRIEKLLVLSATGCDLPQEEIEKRFNLTQLTGPLTLKALSRQKVLTLLDTKHHNNEDIIQLIQTMYKELGEAVFKKQISATLHRLDLTNDLKKLSKPILFLYSRGDRLVNKQWLHQLNDVPHITQIILPNDSHMLPLEEPNLVATHVQAFFK